MATLWKAIRPATLKKDAMRLALLNELRSVGRDIRADFEKTTETWEHKPKFEMLISLSQPGPTVLVDTNDAVYGYVSKGTRPHLIFPKRAKALRFPGTYAAKTTPGVIASKPGGSRGAVVYSQGVAHPGTKARKFDEEIAKKWEKPFKRRMEAGMKKARQASGHAI